MKIDYVINRNYKGCLCYWNVDKVLNQISAHAMSLFVGRAHHFLLGFMSKRTAWMLAFSSN